MTIWKLRPEDCKIKKKGAKAAKYYRQLKPGFILENKKLTMPLIPMLTPLDLVVGLPVNGLIAPCAPSPSFWASYFNRIFSYISLSLSLSFRKYLLVAKYREGILKGLALASRAI